MFTGLVEEVGQVLWIRATKSGTQLQLAAPLVAEDLRKGDSVAVNGCCLTVTSLREGTITFDLLAETLDRTNLGALRRESAVNLERAMPANGRFGGHLVQGHIDCTARVLGYTREGADSRLEVELPEAFAHYAAFKGSIALNGISLTIAELHPESIVVWVIPHTREHTNLEKIQSGDRLNVEFDLVAKYIERMFPRMIVTEEESA